MFRNGRNSRRKSANMMRCRDNKLHVVELTLSDVDPVNISQPTKFETFMKQQEMISSHRPGTGHAEIYLDEVRTFPHYPSDVTLNVEGEIYDDHTHSANIFNNQRKSVRNSRYQVTPESDNCNRPVRPYRPISSHQYLTSTELKDSTINDKNVHLGRPTRTTLLRDRQRRRSVPTVDITQHLQQKASQKLDPRTPTRYEAVKTILSSMIPPGQSLHSFLCGARYNRSNWIETIGSLDLASDQPAMGGSSVNTPHQRQRSTSEQFDVDYTPKAPPESPVDFNSHAVKDGCAETFLPALSGSGSAEPTSPLPKQVPDNRGCRKIAWEEEIKRLSPLPDRAASTQDKVRFQTEEPIAGGNVHGVYHERTHHGVRPSSVRTPAAQVVKPGRDMAAVVIHGISLHGAPSACEAGLPPALAEGTRRSWSATTYTASGSRPSPMEFNRLDSLKVTGVKVSGTPDTGRAGGLRLSALKPWRLENDAESTEALVGSRCEGYSDLGTAAGTAKHSVAPSSRSDTSKEGIRELDFNEDVHHEINFNEDVNHEINFNEDVNHDINSDEGINHDINSDEDANHERNSNRKADHEIDSHEDIDHEIDSHEDINHEIDSHEDIDHVFGSKRANDVDVESSKEFDHKVDFNGEVDHVTSSKRKNDGKTYSKTIESDRDKPPPCSIDLSTDHVSETNESIENDRSDPRNESREHGQANREKLGQVNLPDELRGENDITVSGAGRVTMDDMLEELGQFNALDPFAEEGQDELSEQGRVSVTSESTAGMDAYDNRGQTSEAGENSGDDRKEDEEGVVFFITEEQLNGRKKLVEGCHDDRVTKNDEDEDVEEFDVARRDRVKGQKEFSKTGIAEGEDVVVSERSVISPNDDRPTGRWSAGSRN